MKHEKRMTAQDLLNQSSPMLGKLTSFQEAFPQVEYCDVSVKCNGMWDAGGESTYRNPGQFINCSNPVCHGGGFEVGWLIHDMVGKREVEIAGTAVCRGNEASPKGQRVYRKCMRRFTYKISIKYKEGNA